MVSNGPKAKPEKTILKDIRPRQMSMTDRLAQFTPEWADKVIAYWAHAGDFQPLIDALFHGDEIGPATRAFLIRDFAGEMPRKRGLKRTVAQMETDTALYLRIVHAMVDNQISQTAAIQVVADKTDKPMETVRSAFMRIRGDIKDLAPVPKKVNGVYTLSDHYAGKTLR